MITCYLIIRFYGKKISFIRKIKSTTNRLKKFYVLKWKWQLPKQLSPSKIVLEDTPEFYHVIDQPQRDLSKFVDQKIKEVEFPESKALLEFLKDGGGFSTYGIARELGISLDVFIQHLMKSNGVWAIYFTQAKIPTK